MLPDRTAPPPAAQRYGSLVRDRLGGLSLIVLLTLAALHPGQARADAADFQGMPGMWKVQMSLHRNGHPDQRKSYWFCADDGSDPMDTFAAIDLPGLSACQRQSTRRSTTGLAWRLSCPSGRTGQGRLVFDSAEHYRGWLSLPDRGGQVELEARHYAACTGPSD